MIKALIFDFGDVFINLDKKGAMENALNLFEITSFKEDMIHTNIQYEIGKISTEDFIHFYRFKFPKLGEKQIVEAWNYIIKDFPPHRLSFIKALAKQNKYKLILLSNTNELHINYVKQTVSFFEDFKNCFDAFYLSHEIHLRKPNRDIYDFVLANNNLKASECLFIDDTKENTDMADTIGIPVWNINETKEDVITLFKTKKDLF